MPCASFTDFLHPVSQDSAAPFSGIPAQKSECQISLMSKATSKADSNGQQKKPVQVWRTSKKI